jgi:hypothetical protein
LPATLASNESAILPLTTVSNTIPSLPSLLLEPTSLVVLHAFPFVYTSLVVGDMTVGCFIPEAGSFSRLSRMYFAQDTDGIKLVLLRDASPQLQYDPEHMATSAPSGTPDKGFPDFNASISTTPNIQLYPLMEAGSALETPKGVPWANKDSPGYFGHFSPGFRTPLQ